MSTLYRQVRPEEVPTLDFSALASNGLVFVKEVSEDVSEEALLARCRQEALAYVAAIDEFAAEAWCPIINSRPLNSRPLNSGNYRNI